MARVKIVHASGSETGGIRGMAGDQTGREVCTRTWYEHAKGWVTLRCTVPGMAAHIAKAGEILAADSDVGYDQYENQTLWKLLQANGFNIKAVNKKVETDCARFVRVCVQYAAKMMGLNITIPDFYTATLANTLVKTGLFEKLTASKYNTTDEYLERGMIQVTKTKGHTIIIATNGDKANAAAVAEKTYALGERTLRNGSKGPDVEAMQDYLIQLGFSCGSRGSDGDFGDATEQAVEKFQKACKLAVDGIYGPKSHAALMDALADDEVNDPRTVQIVGGDCFIRTAPNTSGKKLGVAKEGDKLEYGGQTSETGWHLVAYKNQNGWLSGKYGKLIEG